MSKSNKRKLNGDSIFFSGVLIIGLVIAFFMFVFKPLQWYIIVSGSMIPEIEIMDLIVVMPQKEYEVGDVITFSSDIFDTGKKELVTHRLDRVTDQGFISMSVAANERDALIVNLSDVKGKVVKVIPKVGILVYFIMKNAVAIIFGMVILLLFAVYREFNENKVEDESSNSTTRTVSF